MEDLIKSIAAEEGWSDATLVSVLIGVLEEVTASDRLFTAACVINAVQERVHG